jgi:CheY-like chemotaxis protein/two-component sensor histidine kinase
MLAFARKQQVDPHPVDLVQLVRGMAEMLERSLGPSIEIETQFPLSLRSVIVDQNQLELALLNLCTNARDAMPNGGSVRITAREEELGAGHRSTLPAGKYVCLSVSDNGEGMSPETLAHATEPFFTTKGVGKGTGLGLSMVHGTAEQAGGRLFIFSAAGEGTTAEVWLPAAPVKSGSNVADQERAAEDGGGARSLHVLAVDDDALVLFNTVAMLEDLGHTVIEASSGPAALDALRGASIDLVVTDQAMPKMTGVQLIEAIRASSPDLPAILATGYAEIPGGVGDATIRLNKPFTGTELAKAIAASVGV